MEYLPCGKGRGGDLDGKAFEEGVLQRHQLLQIGQQLLAQQPPGCGAGALRQLRDQLQGCRAPQRVLQPPNLLRQRLQEACILFFTSGSVVPTGILQPPYLLCQRHTKTQKQYLSLGPTPCPFLLFFPKVL